MPEYHTDIRLQLFNSGYLVVPNLDKRCVIPGWNTPEVAAREINAKRIARWPNLYPRFTATGLLMQEGVASIDGDINDSDGAAATFDEIKHIAYEVEAHAPTRYSEGTHKFMLFCRVDLADPDLFFKQSSRTFFRPGEEGLGKGHKLEIFGGGRSAKGLPWQCGIYGPREHDERGAVKSRYVWDETRAALHEVALRDLPLVTAKQLHAMINRFEAWATGVGWIAQEVSETDTAGAVYDITDATRFDTDKGDVDITYEELAAELVRHGDFRLRCRGTFIAGWKGSDRVDHCTVFHSPRHDCAAVYVHGNAAIHYPAKFAPVDPAAFAEALAGVAGSHSSSIPPDTPNWRERLVGSGRPKASLHNAKLAVEAIGLTCSSDVFHNRLLIGRGRSNLDMCIGEVTDTHLALLRGHLSNAYGFDLTELHLRDAVIELCAWNPFNPIAEMLAEAEANWDKVERLDRMAVEHFNCDDTPLNRACVRKTMIAAVARVRTPGCKFDTILVLESPEGWNKSAAWSVLAGPENFSDTPILGKESREVQEQLAGVWIHENADLAGMRRAEVELVKTFASRVEDRARPAYGRFLVSQPRQSIEVATTNASRYLQSQTGNRRFWPLVVRQSIDLDRLKRLRLQLWGEAAHWQSQGESLVLPSELWAAARVEQEARRVTHAWEDVLRRLEPVTPGRIGDPETCLVHLVGDEGLVATADIFINALKMPAWRMSRTDSMTLSDVMRSLGWHHDYVTIDRRRVRGYRKQWSTVT